MEAIPEVQGADCEAGVKADRLANLKAAHFRARIVRNGGGLCPVCKGKTYDSKPFCLRHFRRVRDLDKQLCGDVANGIRIEEAIALLRTNRPTTAMSRGTYGRGLCVRRIQNGYRVVMTRFDGTEHEMFRASSVREIQAYLETKHHEWSARNRNASVTMVS